MAAIHRLIERDTGVSSWRFVSETERIVSFNAASVSEADSARTCLAVDVQTFVLNKNTR